MAKILISGGSGLLGRAISKIIVAAKHEVVWLSRTEGESNGIKKYKWDLSKNYINEKAFQGIDSIIHLAGSGIADKRWTKSYKQEIIDSRTKSLHLIFDTLSKLNIHLDSFIGGSAIGYYGAIQSDQIITETDFSGTDFLAESCVLWEKSYLPFINSDVRTVIIRTGIVLSKNGGAYPKMAYPFKLGLGAGIASGNQFFPWIHIDDIANMFVFALLDKNLHGTFNGVSSEFITNSKFSKLLAASFHKPFFLPNIPAFALHLFMGEGAVMVTEGLKISNQKIKEAGFKFKFETAQQALSQLAQTS